jgi:hypothetical protein
MKKFELTMRHTVAIVSYIAASMGYSKEEIKYIAGNMKFGSDDIGEFYEILAEPLNGMVSVKRKDEVKDLIQPFNLAERIQMVIDLILKKSNSTETIDMKPTATIYGFSPYKFSNFIRNPEEEPGMTAHEEHLVDEAIRKATEETLRGLKGKEVETPNFKPAPDVASNEEIDEVNQAIEGLIRVRNKLITNLNEQNEEQPKFNWDNIQKAQEQSEPYEPVKFTEEQRQRQREILGNPFASTSRYDQIGNDKVKKLNEYVIRSKSGNKYVPYSFLSPLDDKPLFDQILHDRTETEAMISRSIEIYPSMDLCKDTLFKVNKPEEMFSFVRVDGDRLYRINDSSVQPWNRSKPLGTIRLVKEDFGLFTSVKLTVEVNESNIEEIVNRNYVDIISILKDINKKHGTSITPDDINADLPAENLGQYLLRNTFGRLVDEVRKDRAHLIKTLVRDSDIVVINDNELTNWLKGKNPTNS